VSSTDTTEHRRLRAEYQEQLDRGGQLLCSAEPCLMRSPVIMFGMAWDLNHAADRQSYLGPAHSRCNRSAGGRKASGRPTVQVCEPAGEFAAWASTRDWAGSAESYQRSIADPGWWQGMCLRNGKPTGC
jgi:hypothetical protein